jgi:hypothetical protein
MLNEADEAWLRSTYPALVFTGDALSGTIDFRASYNRDKNRFLILDDQLPDQTGGIALSGSFQIRIEKRKDDSTSLLPALYVHGIDSIPDRHVNPADSSACLCSPLEEREFLQPAFHFRAFLEQLVIPFLYGQLFYTSEGAWPWAEYAHGATGILESYSKLPDRTRVEECLRQLVRDANWPRIRSTLQQQPYIKGHTLCFCKKMDQIRRCHPAALEGVRRLQQDLRTLGIALP